MAVEQSMKLINMMREKGWITVSDNEIWCQVSESKDELGNPTFNGPMRGKSFNLPTLRKSFNGPMRCNRPAQVQPTAQVPPTNCEEEEKPADLDTFMKEGISVKPGRCSLTLTIKKKDSLRASRINHRRELTCHIRVTWVAEREEYDWEGEKPIHHLVESRESEYLRDAENRIIKAMSVFSENE
jgi:hypothetical protein